MGKRDAQLVTRALYTLADVREAIANGDSDVALDALDEAQEVLESVEHAPGVSVAGASALLGVSEPTVRNWAKHGALRVVPDSAPLQIEAASLHGVSRALNELRKRGTDRDWLRALVDYSHDRQALDSAAVREGTAQLELGELEAA
jgi:DNA-binding transcriptional regulator YdaS (Cro superfamily)